MGLGSTIPLYTGLSGLGYVTSGPAADAARAAGYYSDDSGNWYGQGGWRIDSLTPASQISSESYAIFTALGYPPSQFSTWTPLPARNCGPTAVQDDFTGECVPVDRPDLFYNPTQTQNPIPIFGGGRSVNATAPATISPAVTGSGAPAALTLPFQSFSFGGTSIPLWMIAAGAVLLFLAVKR